MWSTIMRGMKGFVISLSFAVCVATAGGCVSAPCIVGVDRQAVLRFGVPFGECREIIEHVDADGSWISLTHTDSRGLVLSERDQSGRVLRTTVLPTRFHGWFDRDKSTLSPNRSHFAYRDDTGQVQWLDLKNGNMRTLLTTDKSCYVQKVAFITNQSLVAIVYDLESKSTKVIFLDEAGLSNVLYKSSGNIDHLTAVPSLGMLSFVEAYTPQAPKVWLWNMTKNHLRPVLAIPNGICTGTAISPDGNLICILLWNGPETIVILVNLASGKDKVLFSLKHEDEYWRSPGFIGQDAIALVRSTYRESGKRPNNLEIYDLRTGALLISRRFWNIGLLHSNHDGSCILMQVN